MYAKLLKPVSIFNILNITRRYSQKPLSLYKKQPQKPILEKDVILYKYDNPKYFKIISYFGVVQFMFWAYLGQFCVQSMRDAPLPVDLIQDNKISWWKKINLGENKYKNTLTALCFLLGVGILTCSWMFTLRSVRYLVLSKTGKELSIVTYTPAGPNRIMNVPLTHVSCNVSRQGARVQLPLKVKNRNFYYIMDMKGEFRNPELFDRTAGVKRKLH